MADLIIAHKADGYFILLNPPVKGREYKQLRAL